MVATRLTRFIRRHCHVVIAWAMLPMVLLNGHTVTGCGCTGHFEAVCHCHCGISGCSCCGQSGTCSCCKNKLLACSNSSNHETLPSKGESVQGHRCTSIVMYVVVPATVATASVDHDCHAMTLILAPIDLPYSPNSTSAQQIAQWDTGIPPNDLVVVFHRLVI
jgi:hypothetical protein